MQATLRRLLTARQPCEEKTRSGLCGPLRVCVRNSRHSRIAFFAPECYNKQEQTTAAGRSSGKYEKEGFSMSMNTVPERLAALRAAMQANGVDVYLIPVGDPHSSEYLPDHLPP